jgi:signal transduction histidine kinase
MADADLVAVALPDGSRKHLTVRVARGLGAAQLQGLTVPVDASALGAVYTGGIPRSLSGPDWSAYPVWTDVGLGSAYIAPLGAQDRSRGVLVAAKRFGALPFDSPTIRMLSNVGDQAAVALEVADRRADAEKLALLADRDRIGRDLHDLAIQRLFAAGMTLQSVLRITEKQAVRDRVSTAVADLDDTIKVIRSTIFALSEHDTPTQAPSLRAQVLQLCQDAAATLGFAPAVRFTGPVDFEVPDRAVDHTLAVTREALSNAARHAQASKVEVDLETAGGFLLLRIADDGVGMPEGGRRSGLTNIADRAAELGGTFTCGAGERGGSVLLWKIPLDSESDEG